LIGRNRLIESGRYYVSFVDDSAMIAAASPLESFHRYQAVWDPEELKQVLRDLERMSERSGVKQFEGSRRYERKPCSGVVVVRPHRDTRLRCGSRASLEIVARNLSQSGIGVLAPMQFESAEISKEPILRALDVFRDGALLEIGLKRSCGKSLWLSATVVRARIVQHDFLDIGLKFNSRLNVPEALENE
jgi:hypothetical protein